jgi:predicted nucleotidyltransferase
MLTVEQIKDTVQDYFKDKPVKSVYLFGSYARGEAKEESDVDLLLDLDYEQRIGLEFVRWGIVLKKKFKRKVDLVPASVIYPFVMKNAEKDKILMLQK